MASSGALTILKQFLDAVPSCKEEYIVFVNNKVFFKPVQKNIYIVKVNNENLFRRFLWDFSGVKKWLKQNRINPIATISLQNTNFRTINCIPNFIYFHNAIPFSDYKWNLLRKEERTLWFYKNIYPFFIKLYINKKTEVFVQSKIIKEQFAYFFKIPIDKIHVIRPKSTLPFLTENSIIHLNKNKLNLFYPATAFVYKNHSTLFDAISLLSIDLQRNITLHLTCNKQDLQYLIRLKNFSFEIHYLDNIEISQVFQMYYHCDALLYPSYIETIGLPIIEAASTGLPIVVSDLPYARDILSGYNGAVFVLHYDVNKWSYEILRLFELKDKRYIPFNLNKYESWEVMFSIIQDRIMNNLSSFR